MWSLRQQSGSQRGERYRHAGQTGGAGAQGQAVQAHQIGRDVARQRRRQFPALAPEPGAITLRVQRGRPAGRKALKVLEYTRPL